MAEDQIYMSIAPWAGGPGLWLAVVSQGQPCLGDATCTVLTVEVVKSEQEAEDWFKRVLVEQPWIERQ